ncbi:MerR family transcriptional regulator [Elusimicrobiota bacterium]
MAETFSIPPLPEKEYFSIGEVSKIVQLPAYVLRYWESEFKLIRPIRRSSGQRKYMRKDIEIVFKVKDLLHNKKFTILGAKKYLAGDKRRKESDTLNVSMQNGSANVDSKAIKDIKQELQEILDALKK